MLVGTSGRDLLIAPVLEKGATSRDLYLPAGDWYDWWTSERAAGGRMVARAVDLSTMPIYVRAGAIIPVDAVRQHADQPASEPTTLRVYPRADGEFTLYDDDGISQACLQGKGTWTRLTWNERARRLTIAPSAPTGAANQVSPREFRVALMTEGTTKSVRYAWCAATVTF